MRWVATAAVMPSRSRAAGADDTLVALPQSDSAMVIDVHRLLSETLPQVFTGDAAKLAQINSEIDKFKTETGVDARAVNRVVLGTRYVYPSATVTKFETVATV